VTELEEQFDGLRQQFNDLAERVDSPSGCWHNIGAPPTQLPRGS